MPPHGILRLASKAGIVIELNGFEPGFDVFAGFGMLAQVFGESGKQFIYTTLGTATGDLAGALGVYIFSITPGMNGVVAKVHHHWVTDAGDTIYLQDATANAFQVGPYSGIHAVADNSYTVNIIGGTGRFAGATGQLSTIGVLDTKQGKVVLRYQGTICFGRPE
jgi:hypothetical protein